MWRTVLVENPVKLSLSKNQMALDGEKQRTLPIEDLGSVIIDNPQVIMTVPLINALSDAGTTIVICNEKHLPNATITGSSGYYRLSEVFYMQRRMPLEMTQSLWKEIVKQKIKNQWEAVSRAADSNPLIEKMYSYINEIEPGDPTNKEGSAARLYFPMMFSEGFTRGMQNHINAALDYAYAVVRSTIAKSLVGHGLNASLGLHHIGRSNAFNLADDMIEPYRAIVDSFVKGIIENDDEKLSKEDRESLVAILDYEVSLKGKTMKLRNTIPLVIESLVSIIMGDTEKKFVLPSLCSIE